MENLYIHVIDQYMYMYMEYTQVLHLVLHVHVHGYRWTNSVMRVCLCETI